MSTTSPKIMMITPMSNWPADSGGRIRSGSIAKILAKTAKVRILSLFHDKPLQTPPEIEEIVIRPDSAPVIWSMCSQEHPLAPPISEMSIYRINRNIEAFRPDIIFFEETVTTGFLDRLKIGSAKTVFSTQNVDSDILAEKGVADLEVLNRARNDEISAIQKTDYLLTCSSRDAGIFKEMTGQSAFVLTNPIPDERGFDLPILPNRYESLGFLFAGSMSYFPNADAVKYIVGKVLPIMPKNVSADIVGRDAHIFDRQTKKNSRINLHSNVPEMLIHLAQASQTLMPIKSGGGTRLKVLEAMAAGVVVTATEKAVEGIGLTPDVHFRLADTPQRFVEIFLSNIANPTETAKLAQTAREFVRDQYSSIVFEHQLSKLVNVVLSDKEQQS